MIISKADHESTKVLEFLNFKFYQKSFITVENELIKYQTKNRIPEEKKRNFYIICNRTLKFIRRK